MKGLMLTMDTVIVLIIAVAVLAILVLFFRGTGGRGVDALTLERQKADLCGAYVALDSDCDGVVDSSSDETELNTIWSNREPALKEVCKKLNVQYCSSPGSTSNSKKCIQMCCMACPKTDVY